MFRISRNHHQALSKKYKDPLHKTIKMRFGIPNVHNKHLVMIHMYHIGSHFRPTIPNSWGAYPEKITHSFRNTYVAPATKLPTLSFLSFAAFAAKSTFLFFWFLPHLRQNPKIFLLFATFCGKIQKIYPGAFAHFWGPLHPSYPHFWFFGPGGFAPCCGKTICIITICLL